MSRASKKEPDSGPKAPPKPNPEVVWHDLECGGESIDLRLWTRLANERGGPVLELGCGAGRVGLHVAKRKHEVIGIDSSVALVAAFNDRARAAKLSAKAISVDVRNARVRVSCPLVIAPMQLIQAIGDVTQRQQALTAGARNLAPGGLLAFAIVEPDAAGEAAQAAADGIDALPDQAEIDGWVFSSRLVDLKPSGRGIVIQRMRETVSPEGEASAEPHSEILELFDADRFEEEAALTGLRPVKRHNIGPGYGIASTVVTFEVGR